jgi:hypothetical protein
MGHRQPMNQNAETRSSKLAICVSVLRAAAVITLLNACGLDSQPTSLVGTVSEPINRQPEPQIKKIVTGATPEYAVTRITDAPDSGASQPFNGRDFQVAANQVGFLNSTREELAFIANSGMRPMQRNERVHSHGHLPGYDEYGRT